MTKYAVSNGFVTLQYESEKEAQDVMAFLNDGAR